MRRILALTLALVAGNASAQGECTVTMAQFSALQTGMTYSKAVEMLGCNGEEMSRSDLGGIVTIMLMWRGESAGGNMNAMFQNDRLVTKAQFGLR